MAENQFNEDAWLKDMVEAVKNNYKELKYFWPLKRGKEIHGDKVHSKYEVETVKLFNNISKEFPKDFKEKDTSNINFSDDIKDSDLKPILNVIEWGGTYRAKKKEERNKAVFKINNNLAKIKKYKNCKTLLGNDDKIREIACSMNDGVNISTWSKILAAYKPGTLFIYDSRVAIALSFITLKSKRELPCFWEIPDYYIAKQDKNAIEKMKEVIDTYRNNTPNSEIADTSICYARYLKLLKKLAEDPDICKKYEACKDQILGETIQQVYDKTFKQYITDNKERKISSIMAHMEKMLFMMKEGIVEDIKKGKWL